MHPVPGVPRSLAQEARMETQQDGTNEQTVVGQLWSRWTALVELFARRDRRRHSVDPAVYYILHHDLVTACQALAATGDGVARTYYENLETLARPWFTCRVLEQADREILLDLLLRCQAIQHELVGERWADVVRRWAWRTAVVTALCLLPAVLVWGAEWVGPTLAGWWRSSRLTLQHLTHTQRLVIGGVVTLLIAAFVLRVSRR
jgi:hypothetical protein